MLYARPLSRHRHGAWSKSDGNGLGTHGNRFYFPHCGCFSEISRISYRSKEDELAPHLDVVVAAYPTVNIGGYPRRNNRLLLRKSGC